MGHTTPVECVRFGWNEDLVCGGAQSGALKIWDLESTKIVRTLTGHKSNIRTIDFHPYGDFIGTGSLDTNIKVIFFNHLFGICFFLLINFFYYCLNLDSNFKVVPNCNILLGYALKIQKAFEFFLTHL